MSELERRKEYLIRSLFYDSPDLSTIQEENDESSTAVSPPLSLESYRSVSPCPPPAHCDGLWSPLPPLTIELVKEPNKHDEPEEFYKRLHRKILKIYKRIFFEDRSDISDICTSDDDDTPTYNDPIDYSTSRVELVESTLQSVASDQENYENVTIPDTKNQRSNDEIELQLNSEPSDEESRNESHDDNGNNNDDDDFPNLEAIVENAESGLPNLEPDDGNTPNLEVNVESDDGHVSSSTNVMANSTESDGNRDSVTPLSSTVVLSCGTSDEELCLERNEAPANATHQISPEAEEMEARRTSGRRSPTGSIPRAEPIPNEENVNIEAMEADNDEIEGTSTPGRHEGTPRPHEETSSKDMEVNASMDTNLDNNSVQSGIEEMRTPRPHRSTGSPTHHHDNVHPNESNVVIVEHHASMESDTNEEEMPTRPNNTIENPDNLDLFDLVRISSPKEITEDNTRIIKPDEYTANMSSEDNSRDFSPEYNSRRNSPNENNRKRKSVSPCRCMDKKVKFADKSIQTDHNSNEIVQNIDININPADKNLQIDHLNGIKVVQNIKIHINTFKTIG